MMISVVCCCHWNTWNSLRSSEYTICIEIKQCINSALNPRTLDNLNFFQVSLKVRVIRCQLYFKTKWNLSKLENDKRLSSMLHSNIISGGFFLQSGACEYFNPFLLTFLLCSTLSWWSVQCCIHPTCETQSKNDGEVSTATVWWEYGEHICLF